MAFYFMVYNLILFLTDNELLKLLRHIQTGVPRRAM